MRPTGGENPEFVLREYLGMNTLTSREAIDENEFWWCENAIPIAPGSLYPVGLPTLIASLTAESGAPSYTTNFNAGGTDFAFSVWANSGNAYVTNLTTLLSTKIFSGTLTSGKTAATQWNNQGLLIIDPTGYFDWNVTTANTLTTQNNSVSSATLGTSSVIVAGGASLKLQFAVSGTGATFTSSFSVTSVVVTTPGTGYAVGDQLLLSDGNPTTPAVITITAVSGGGISGISLSNVGAYPGPTSGTAVATGPAGSTFTTSSNGTGAVFAVHIGVLSLTVVNRGSGYKATDTVSVLSGATTIATFTLAVSGVLAGTTIASYAGRVWIGSNRTVSVTDVGSYFSFAGSGTAFTINDAYLHNAITCLFATNNYLFIFGDDSIDALSNVTVVSGIISFSRINLTASIGTSNPNSVFSYLRGVAFYHASGFYLLSGATPEKISEKIAGVIAQITPSSVYGAPCVVQGELCAAFLFSFADIFANGTPAAPVSRALFALFFRARWWVSSMAGNPAALFSVPVAGVQTLYAWVANTFYKLFSGAPSPWLLKTRLWDAGAPLKEKQALNVAGAFTFQGAGVSGVTYHIDTEAGLGPAVPALFPVLIWVNNAGQVLTWVNNAHQSLTWQQSPQGYSLNIQEAQAGGTQYLGLTITGQADVQRINMLALRGKQDRAMLA